MTKQIDRLKLMGNFLRKTARQKGIKLIDIKIKNVKPNGFPKIAKQKALFSRTDNMNMKQQLKDLFYEWYYSEFAEDITDKEKDISFRERHSEEILNRFAEQVGL